jgi:hypothetical protein
MPEKNNLKEERFMLSHSSRSFSPRWLIPLLVESEKRENIMVAGACRGSCSYLVARRQTE